MKNATKYAEVLRSVYKRITREHKPPPRQPLEPLPALVRSAMSFDVSDAKADDAMRAIEREFVDLNELRVATELEVQELLGVRYPQIEERVTIITTALNYIFEREHTMNLERLKTVSKRDARQFLRDIPGIHPFVEGYVMLFAFDGHAFPIDTPTLDYLADQNAFARGTTRDEAQRFVEHHLKADECYELFVGLRRVAYAEGKRKKKR
jgi:endonuclease III